MSICFSVCKEFLCDAVKGVSSFDWRSHIPTDTNFNRPSRMAYERRCEIKDIRTVITEARAQSTEVLKSILQEWGCKLCHLVGVILQFLLQAPSVQKELDVLKEISSLSNFKGKSGCESSSKEILSWRREGGPQQERGMTAHMRNEFEPFPRRPIFPWPHGFLRLFSTHSGVENPCKRLGEDGPRSYHLDYKRRVLPARPPAEVLGRNHEITLLHI
jgi:hypothetical protein